MNRVCRTTDFLTRFLDMKEAQTMGLKRAGQHCPTYERLVDIDEQYEGDSQVRQHLVPEPWGSWPARAKARWLRVSVRRSYYRLGVLRSLRQGQAFLLKRL